MSEQVIQTNKLTKQFGDKIAVDSLDFHMDAGSILGFLGANGAGKTTTIRMMMGHLHPTSGDVSVLGTDPWQLTKQQRQEVAYVSENMDLPDWVTAKAAIELNRRFYTDWNHMLAEKLLDEFELRKAGAYKTLSRGQKRKVCILLALCQKPKLLIMDEPASGLDVTARRALIQQVLETACDENTAVLISSHLLSDLERTVDRIAILNEGKLILMGQLEDFKAGIRKIHFHKKIARNEIAQRFKIIRYEPYGDQETVVAVLDYEENRFNNFVQQTQSGNDVQVYPMNLEDMFVELTRKSEAEVELP